MRLSLLMIVILAFSFLLTACDPKKTEFIEVAVIQQFSPLMNEWQNVTLFYGFGENYNVAEKMLASFKGKSERPLRVQTYKMKRGELKAVYDLKTR